MRSFYVGSASILMQPVEVNAEDEGDRALWTPRARDPDGGRWAHGMRWKQKNRIDRSFPEMLSDSRRTAHVGLFAAWVSVRVKDFRRAAAGDEKQP